MKANETPEKIYINPTLENRIWLMGKGDISFIEYTRTDAFIEKACVFLKSYRQDTPDRLGYIAGIVNDKTIEDFRKYMKGE